MSVKALLIVAALFLTGGLAAATPPDPAVSEALGPWPCLDAPGCGAPATPAAEVQAPEVQDPSVIPLPTALALFGAGLTGIALIGRRRT